MVQVWIRGCVAVFLSPRPMRQSLDCMCKGAVTISCRAFVVIPGSGMHALHLMPTQAMPAALPHRMA